MTSIPPDTSPTEEELRAEVHRLVHPVVQLARAEHGAVPGVGTLKWWAAPVQAQLAAILILGEAWLIHDPDRAIAERFKAMSVDLCKSDDWSSASRRPSYSELQRRRHESGPLADSVFDPKAARRWVETGGSTEPAA